MRRQRCLLLFQLFVLAHNNRQLVFHHVPGDDGILPPTGFCQEPAPGRDGAGSGLLCPFCERMEICVTLLSCEDVEVLAHRCFLLKNKTNISAMGSRHPGACVLGNLSGLAVPDRNAAGGKAGAASSKQAASTWRAQKDFTFHLSLPYSLPVPIQEDMKKSFPTFLVIRQGEHNRQWWLKWFMI